MKQQNAASLSDIITEGIDKTLAKAMPNATRTSWNIGGSK